MQAFNFRGQLIHKGLFQLAMFKQFTLAQGSQYTYFTLLLQWVYTDHSCQIKVKLDEEAKKALF